MFLGRRLVGRFCVALAALALYGCPQDGDDDVGGDGGGGDPKINLLVTARCGNMLAIPSREELAAGDAMTAEVRVQGIDPGQSSREILPGTEVTLFIADEKGEPGGMGGRFTSGAAASSGIRFNGGRASDRFFCTAPGVLTIHAQVGTLKDGRIVASEYPPGSGLEPVIRTDKSLGGFPIQCVSRAAYEDECGSVPPPDAGGPDGGVLDDGGMDTDAGDGGAGDGGTPDAEVLPPRYSLNYDSPPSSELVMVIRDSFRTGASDHKDLTFRLTDRGQAPRQRFQVRFDVGDSRQAGVTVLPDVAETDAEGYVTVQLRAGGTPGIVSVFATARIAGLDRDLKAQSPPVTIRGGLPSKRGLYFVCEEPVVGAFTGRSVLHPNDWGLVLRDNTTCTVQLVDRASGRVDEPNQVFFFSEAGSVDQAAASDPMLGVAQTLLRSGPPAPFDVPPQDYEREAGLVTGDPVAGELNPRDGLVTLIAVTRGEEEFTDVNGDLVFDEGIDIFEPRFDLPEPFIDRNDNGQYDDGEVFRDLNRSGGWDPSNGRWDAITDIWDDVRVLWVGDMDPSPGRTTIQVASCSRDNQCYDEPNVNVHAACPNADFFLLDGGYVDIAMRFTDSNGNCVNGYDEGSVTIAVEGNIEVAPQEAFDITLGECFTGGCGGLCPAPRTYVTRISDSMRTPPVPGQPPPQGQPASVRIVLNYQAANGDVVNQPFFLTGCVQ